MSQPLLFDNYPVNDKIKREKYKIDPQLETSWKVLLKEEFTKPYFAEIKKFLLHAKKKGDQILPPSRMIFNAYNKTPFNKVKAIIIGQDPYHHPGQAHGLCFSVPKEIKAPPSLVNIFKEIKQDLGIPIPNHGNLEKWADQGVLLLNSILTVKAKTPASHKDIGWEEFTNATIRKLSEEKNGLIFLLWGRFAQDKSSLIDSSRHHILTAPHPSPFSAHNGFFGCNHFSITNKLLEKNGKPPINWQIT